MSAPDKARLYAESSARVYETTKADAMARVRLGRSTPAQAFAVCRRKIDGLRVSYFARKSDWGGGLGTDEAWKAFGPEASHAALYREWFAGAVSP